VLLGLHNRLARLVRFANCSISSSTAPARSASPHRGRDLKVQAPVWTSRVVVRQIGADHAVQVALVEDQHPVQAFRAHNADSTLRIRIRPRPPSSPSPVCSPTSRSSCPSRPGASSPRSAKPPRCGAVKAIRSTARYIIRTRARNGHPLRVEATDHGCPSRRVNPAGVVGVADPVRQPRALSCRGSAPHRIARNAVWSSL
jgi:hypothetical protein